MVQDVTIPQRVSVKGARMARIIEQNLFPDAGALRARLLSLLVRLAQRIVQALDPLDLAHKGRPIDLVEIPGQVNKRSGLEELVLAVVEVPLGDLLRRLLARHPEDLLEDVNVVGDGEEVAAVLVGKEVVELGKARPGDAAQAQAARLVGCEEDAVFPRVRALRRVREVDGEELLDAVDLAVEQGRCALVVGGHGQGLEGLAVKDGGAEYLGAGGDAFAGEWDNGVLDGCEERLEQRFGMGSRHGIKLERIGF